MGKDLRTTAVSLKLHRYPKLDATVWGLQNPQPFFPPLERLFKTETVGSLQDYGVRLTDEIGAVVDHETIRTLKGKNALIHRKTTMILSPFKWMRGDYGVLGLPKPEPIASDMQQTLQSPHTAGYVGALSSILLSESGCPNFPKVYGVYVGIAKDHTIDISDDYEDLCDRKWFMENVGKTFDIRIRSADMTPVSEFQHTRSHRPGVVLGDETAMDGVEDIDADHVSNPSSRSHESSYLDEASSSAEEDRSSYESEDAFEIGSCRCSDASSTGSYQEEDSEPFAWATFHDVPVITTVMEQCEGSFYKLIEDHREESHKHVAWIAQIVFALAYAQRTFGFVHNDLHGNNVMYVKTHQEFVHTKHNGVCYRIPTYGYLIKIIDFDRAIVSLRMPGMKEPRQFVSSQFQDDEEAAGQYNMDPFMNQSHPYIGPCASFDLCRFATSMFWDIFPEGPEHETDHPLFEMFKQWMTQSDGTSVLFRKQRDDHDRYHGFHLYKAIARYCKDSVPRRETSRFSIFQVPSIPIGTPCLFIES